MERINLVKYGFERAEAHDFSDDGARFYCYHVGNIRVSKCIDRGEAYIAGRIEDNKLTFEEYSNLPHYMALDKLNGVSTSTITEADIIQLYNDCIAFEKEYYEAVEKVVNPTLADLEKHYKEIADINQQALNEIDKLLGTNASKIFSLQDYQLRWFADYYKSLKRIADADYKKQAAQDLNTAYARNEITKKPEVSWYYGKLKEYFEKN